MPTSVENQEEINMKILFSGGGTLGPVTPLIALKEMIQSEYPDAEFVWIGTNTGPERDLIGEQGIRFIPLSSGKFRRYFSLFNILDIFRIVAGFFQSLKIIWKENPTVCISAGGYISVPLHYAASVFSTPTWIHQQDREVGLANRLMSPLASVITVATQDQQKQFAARKTVWLGNPVRKDLFAGTLSKAKKIFGIESSLPIVFATGGGTGSLRVNQMVIEALPHLEGVCEVIHLSGKERPHDMTETASSHFDFYHTYEFFTSEMKEAYTAAEVVISRGGFGTLTEIAALKKAAILIPKPGHQEQNVQFLIEGQGALMLNEKNDNGLVLAKTIKELLADAKKRKDLGETLHELLPPADPALVHTLLKKFS